VLTQWLRRLTWTPELASQWQEFYNSASRILFYGRSGQFENEILFILPTYTDLPSEKCAKSMGHENTFSFFLIFVSFLIKLVYI
jgi:hypothetical protein